MPDVPERCPMCGATPDGPDCLRRQLAAARAVVEAARRVVNAKHDVDPVDVYELREAIKRYEDEDERCGGGGTPTE